MMLQRDFTGLPNARFLAVLWQLPFSAGLLWRLERIVCWFTVALKGDMPEARQNASKLPGVDFSLRVPLGSLAILPDLIAFEISERTPFDPQATLAAYRITPDGNDLQVKVAVLPAADYASDEQLILSGGISFGAQRPESLVRVMTSPAVLGLAMILGVGVASSAVLDTRLAEAEAAILRSTSQYRDAAHQAVTLRGAAEAERAVATAAGRMRGEVMSRIRLLSLLSETLPDTVWLGQVEIVSAQVRITGYAPSAAEVIALLDAADGFSQPRFAAPVAVDDDGLETFAIEFQALAEDML